MRSSSSSSSVIGRCKPVKKREIVTQSKPQSVVQISTGKSGSIGVMKGGDHLSIRCRSPKTSCSCTLS